MKSLAAARNSSSIVSMRLVSSAPVFSTFCLPILPKTGSTVASSLSVAQMVLAELPGGIAEGLEHVGDGGVIGAEPKRGGRQADLGEAGADRGLAGDKRGASSRATLLGIPVGKQRPLLCDPIDIGRAVSHHAEVVGAYIRPANVIAHDEKDIGLLVARHGCLPMIRAERSPQSRQR